MGSRTYDVNNIMRRLSRVSFPLSDGHELLRCAGSYRTRVQRESRDRRWPSRVVRSLAFKDPRRSPTRVRSIARSWNAKTTDRTCRPLVSEGSTVKVPGYRLARAFVVRGTTKMVGRDPGVSV